MSGDPGKCQPCGMLQLVSCHLYIQAVQLPDYEAICQCTRRNILGDINIHEHSYDYPKSSRMAP